MKIEDFLPFGGGILSGVAGLFGQNKQNKANLELVREQNNAQMALAKYQADRNLDLWNLNNEYNTPKAQMQRYKDAGLNPNLIYGNGSASAGNSSSPADGYNAPTLNRANVSYGNTLSAAQTMMNGLTQAMSVKKTAAETAAIYQNMANLKEDNNLKKLTQIQMMINNAKSGTELKFWEERMRAEIANLDSRNVLNFAQAELADSNRFTNNALRPYVVAEAKQRAASALEETIQKRFQNSLNGMQRQLLVARLANLIADTELKNANTSVAQISSAVDRILLDSGLNLRNDEVDRVIYNMFNGRQNYSNERRYYFNLRDILGTASQFGGILSKFFK